MQYEMDFGPHIPCKNPKCKELVPLRSEDKFCSSKCRQSNKVDRFIDEGEVS